MTRSDYTRNGTTDGRHATNGHPGPVNRLADIPGMVEAFERAKKRVWASPPEETPQATAERVGEINYRAEKARGQELNRVDSADDETDPSPPPSITPASPSAPDSEQASRGSRVYKRGPAGGHPIDELLDWLGDYIVLGRSDLLLLAAWVQAAWLAEEWDRFPHLSINSPVRQCGKTQLLKMLTAVCPGAKLLVSTTTAAIYRSVNPGKTLLLDEAQSMFRVGDENVARMRELFCGSIERDAKVERCTGQDHNPTEFSCYCPKVMAYIGPADTTLADRCLLVSMRRKTKEEKVKAFKLRAIKDQGQALAGRLQEWASQNWEQVKKEYDALEEALDPGNDRMSELFQPLLAVLRVQFGGDSPQEKLLEECARQMAEHKAKADGSPHDLQLLTACKEIFDTVKEHPKDGRFLPTKELIARLVEREEEPWATWVRGRPINAEALANLLRPFGIAPVRNHDQSARGYVPEDFEDAWARYLPPFIDPSNPSSLATLADDRPEGYDAYLKTPRWLEFAAEVVAHWGGRCAVCYAAGPLSVHHRTYERMGQEEMTDVVPLCGGCHPTADKARRQAKARERGEAG